MNEKILANCMEDLKLTPEEKKFFREQADNIYTGQLQTLDIEDFLKKITPGWDRLSLQHKMFRFLPILQKEQELRYMLEWEISGRRRDDVGVAYKNGYHTAIERFSEMLDVVE